MKLRAWIKRKCTMPSKFGNYTQELIVYNNILKFARSFRNIRDQPFFEESDLIHAFKNIILDATLVNSLREEYE
jgi:hypothetical protein